MKSDLVFVHAVVQVVHSPMKFEVQVLFLRCSLHLQQGPNKTGNSTGVSRPIKLHLSTTELVSGMTVDQEMQSCCQRVNSLVCLLWQLCSFAVTTHTAHINTTLPLGHDAPHHDMVSYDLTGIGHIADATRRHAGRSRASAYRSQILTIAIAVNGVLGLASRSV